MPRGPGLPSAYRTWTSMMPPAGRPLPAPPPIPRCARSEEAERQKSNRGSKTCEERRDIRYLQGLDRGRGKKGRSYEFTEAQEYMQSKETGAKKKRAPAAAGALPG